MIVPSWELKAFVWKLPVVSSEGVALPGTAMSSYVSDSVSSSLTEGPCFSSTENFLMSSFLIQSSSLYSGPEALSLVNFSVIICCPWALSHFAPAKPKADALAGVLRGHLHPSWGLSPQPLPPNICVAHLLLVCAPPSQGGHPDHSV